MTSLRTKKLLAAALTVSIFTLYSGLANAATLSAGTSVTLELATALSTKDAKEGEVVEFRVATDVVDPTTKAVLITANTTAKGIITRIEKNGIAGKPGELALDIQSTEAVDGTLVPLTAQFNDKGDGKRGLAIGLAAVGTFVFLWPLAFMLFKKGKDAEIPVGSRINSFVRANTEIAVATPSVAAPNTTLSELNQLEKLFELKEKGILTEAEFAAKKAELLGKPETETPASSPLEKLHALYQAGALSKAEYDAQKAQLLNRKAKFNPANSSATVAVEADASTEATTPDYLKKYIEE